MVHVRAWQARIVLFIAIMATGACARLFSRQTRGTSWRGNVEIQSCTRRITVHSYFLDIEEDIELAPVASRKPPSNEHTLEICGLFNLPAQSVITGILIWDGENILRGKLKGKETARTEYEDFVDRETAPPPRPRDPILIEKVGSVQGMDRYNCAIYPVTWGKARKIRIRYLSPQKYVNGKLMMPMPAAMLSEASVYPSEITQHISSYGETEKITVVSKYDTAQYALPVTIKAQCSPNVLSGENIHLTGSDRSMMVRTSFDEGRWKGNYALFWGAPPDSLLINAGLRREIVFLWKWNFWNTFVYAEGSRKRLSPYGRDAVLRARQLSDASSKITDAGDKVGLLLEKGSPAANKLFPLCGKASAGLDSLRTFLGSIDSVYLTSALSGTSPPARIRIDANEREEFFRQSAQSFDISLKMICSLFSKHDKVVKHIVYVSCGPAPEMPNPESFYTGADSLLGDAISVSAHASSPRYPSGYWPGVPLYRIVEKHGLRSEGELAEAFFVPAKTEAFYAATLVGGDTRHTIELLQMRYTCGDPFFTRCYNYAKDTIAVDTMFFAGHSTAAWSDAVEWRAYDRDNALLGTYMYTPPAVSSPQDAFCAKLWAGAHNPVSDTSFLRHRGARYGVVDENYSLLALEHDAMPQKETELVESEGLPFLTDNEIFAPKLAESYDRRSTAAQTPRGETTRFAFRDLGNGNFKVVLPDHEKTLTIRIYDLRGRLVCQLKKRAGGDNSVRFRNKDRLSRGIYTVLLITDKSMHVKRLRIAG
jgi:hypothetical protein